MNSLRLYFFCIFGWLFPDLLELVINLDLLLQTRTGQGQLRADRSDSPVVGILSRGELPVNPQPPASLDYSQDQTRSVCRPRVRDQGVCNSCAGQGTVTSIEYCLCLAGEGELRPRSVQQISECTDGEQESSIIIPRLTAHCQYLCRAGSRYRCSDGESEPVLCDRLPRCAHELHHGRAERDPGPRGGDT